MMVILQNIRKAIAFFAFFTCISVFSQTTYDFTSGLTLYSTGAGPITWLSLQSTE